MTGYLSALMALFSRAGLPVYLADHVPDGVDFPCATCRAALPAYAGEAQVEVTGWFRSDASVQDCAAFLQRLIALVPDGGLLLHTAAGPVALYRAQPLATFLKKGSVTGGQACFRARCYFTQGGA